MKVTIKRKVANGLVIGLMMPHAAGVVAEAMDLKLGGLDAFAAEEDFSLDNTSGAVTVSPVVADPCDPSGVDPSGVDTVCVDPSGGLPTLCVRAPTTLMTSEYGTADQIEVYGAPGPDPSGTYIYQVSSNRPDEALPAPQAVVIGPNSCEPQSIWVYGQNDSEVDGDQPFAVQLRSELGYVEAVLPGVNLDNDRLRWPLIDVEGPRSLAVGDSGMFDVYVSNFGRTVNEGAALVIQPTPGLLITDYVVSGGGFKGKPKLSRSGELIFKDVVINAQETMIVSLRATLVEGGPQDQVLRASIVDAATGDATDNDGGVRTSLR